MKTSFRIIMVSFFLATLMSCNNDFLKEQEEVLLYTFDSPLILSSKYPDNTVTFTIPDAGNESFSIRSQPKWLQLEPLQGRFTGGVTTLQYRFVDPGYQTYEGYYSAQLVIAVEHVGYFQVEVMYGDFEDTDGNPGPVADEGQVTAIEGTVVDAAYDKASDQLVIVTTNPNRLLLMKTAAGTSSSIALDMVPQCLELSENGEIFVGFTVAFLSVYQLETLELLQTYTLNFVPFDLALGGNDWCYLSPAGRDYDSLRCLNLISGELVARPDQSYSYNFYGSTRLSKVRGKPLLAATRTSVSPTGLLLFDISQGLPQENIAYWHVDLYGLWPCRDGNRFIDGEGEVYFMPEYNTEYNNPLFNLDQYGKLELDQYVIYHVDESETKNCFFVAEGQNRNDGYNQNNAGIIQQFDAGSLSLQNAWHPSMKVIRKDGSTVVAFHEVRYAFANNAGTRLYALRRLAPDFGISNQWSLEVFDVD